MFLLVVNNTNKLFHIIKTINWLFSHLTCCCCCQVHSLKSVSLLQGSLVLLYHFFESHLVRFLKFKKFFFAANFFCSTKRLFDESIVQFDVQCLILLTQLRIYFKGTIITVDEKCLYLAIL
jgi:hypothetical protein